MGYPPSISHRTTPLCAAGISSMPLSSRDAWAGVTIPTPVKIVQSLRSRDFRLGLAIGGCIEAKRDRFHGTDLSS